MRARVAPTDYLRYRYQIDIDGNSNAWEGLFMRLLTGSPVLKVASGPGYEQWYYDRLIPWTNFVPVAADMSDLAEKVSWLRANDDIARRIGEAGRSLAWSLDEREVAGASPVIRAAMRADADAPLWDVSFAEGNSIVVEPGCFVRLPRPPGFGEFVLMVEVSADAGEEPVILVTANDEAIARRTIAGRTTIYALAPKALTRSGDSFELEFRIDGGTGSAVLHRVGVAANGRECWTGFPDANAFVDHLNSAGLPPTRTGRARPRGISNCRPGRCRGRYGPMSERSFSGTRRRTGSGMDRRPRFPGTCFWLAWTRSPCFFIRRARDFGGRCM
jgi:hypothetical protein